MCFLIKREVNVKEKDEELDMMYGMYSFLSIGKTSQVDERFSAKTENAEVYFPLLAANYVWHYFMQAINADGEILRILY